MPGAAASDGPPGDAEPDLVDAAQRAVLDAAGWEPVSLDQLATATGLDFDELSLAIERLVASGHLDRRGAWLERVSAR